MPHVNKRPVAKKQIFVQTPFSHSTLKSEQKNSRRKTTLFLAPFPASAWPKLLLHFDFIQIVKMCEQTKKDSAPIQFKFFNLNSNFLKKERYNSQLSRLLNKVKLLQVKEKTIQISRRTWNFNPLLVSARLETELKVDFKNNEKMWKDLYKKKRKKRPVIHSN